MEKIATKTKILLWGVVGEKEKIDFDLCDFSSEQVAQLDRMVRADGDNTVRLTIEPEQKKLQIAAIKADVGLVSLSCREKGQKLKIRGFKSPDERATALKRMSAADTPILLTIEEIQGGLFTIAEGKRTPSTPKDPVGANNHSPETGDKEEEIALKFQGLRGAQASISLLRRDGHWHAGYSIRLGVQSLVEAAADAPPVSQRSAALAAAKIRLDCWLDALIIAGKADAKRALRTRRDQMRDQIRAQVEEMIKAAVDREPGSDEPEEGEGSPRGVEAE